MKKPVILLLIIFLSFLILNEPAGALANSSTNDNWNIEVDEIKIDNSIPTPIKPKQKPEGKSNTNFNENIKQPPFGFSISNTLIDFGIISATSALYRTMNINLYNADNGFIVYAYQVTPLTLSGSNIFIPDTTCDNGFCTEVSSALWENTLTYGYGYRCDDVDGNICPIDFNTTKYYKHFSDFSKGDSMQRLVFQTRGQKEPKAELTFKLNISKQQSAGDYKNNLVFIAVPGY